MKQSPDRRKQRAFAAVLGLAVPALCTADALAIRPGEWEVTVQMNMPGMPVQMPPQTTTYCLTEEQARDPKRAMEKLNESGSNCRMKNFEQSGNSANWTVECTGPQAAQAEGNMTFNGRDAYQGSMQMTVNGPQGPMVMTHTMRGRRVGDCPP